MKKAILALSVVLVALLALGSQAQADGATMHNCPQEGQWAISVWTGGTTDAGEALGTCDIVAAYTYEQGDITRHFPDAPDDVNNMGPLNKYDGVIALGGPAVVAEPETNVEITGTLPDECTINDLTIATQSEGQGHYAARTGLHTKPPTSIENNSAKWVWTQMSIAEQFCLYCGGEFVVCADFPETQGDAHHYSVEVLVTGNEYVIPPRFTERMKFEWGDGRIGVLGYGGKVPFNQTCPNNAWMWDERDPRGFWCEGYPDAVWKARLCEPGESPVPGETYCLWHE